MKKGQGASKRKTLLEAKYGAAAEGDVGRHLDLMHKLESTKTMLQMIESLLAENEPGVTGEHVEGKRQEISGLEREVAESWKRIGRRPEALRKMARVTEQNRAIAEGGKTYIEGAAYPVEWGVQIMYYAGLRDYPTLFEIASEIDPEITASTFSRIVKRYSLLGLAKAKPGRKAERKRR